MFEIIHIDLFCTDVLLSINQSDNKLFDCVSSKFTREEFDLGYEDWTSYARTLTHQKGFIIIRFREKITNNPISIGLVAHEAYHAAFSILENIGIKPCRETEEVYAYLTQHIVTEILKLK